MLVIGLTGGIGTGKSEAARQLEELGALIISADQVGHEAYTVNTEAWEQVVATFGNGILQDDKEIDRRKLGGIVFSDPSQLKKLNQIMHPRMARIVSDKIEAFRGQGVDTVVVEAALLFEAGWDSLVEEVWVTDASEEIIIGRLRERNGLSEEEAKKRINSQMDRMERIGRSDFVINNSGDMAELGTTIKELWDRRVVN
ncbi:MAG: dephospho-CoA kinase [Chloroflexota bacterium]|jgi:dephospho-CoA kinase|nr:MAG: dephospho-CoA kinase [SAR202 cluster bacterium]MCH2671295.1 dephospho-CoA kinase [Dehalococcoidia bacterium]MEE3013785.1 dephospho-CoA kinase [Chloroflexota bacterium]GIS95038.1 MAG: dephospho-CoA kinase [Dehalococcoidia bacterium]|tara:strand:- start:10 stop:606 length:597 start_codon:yes stop_codon:yes gene_type:complete